jgi:hypothetical protein
MYIAKGIRLNLLLRISADLLLYLSRNMGLADQTFRRHSKSNKASIRIRTWNGVRPRILFLQNLSVSCGVNEPEPEPEPEPERKPRFDLVAWLGLTQENPTWLLPRELTTEFETET